MTSALTRPKFCTPPTHGSTLKQSMSCRPHLARCPPDRALPRSPTGERSPEGSSSRSGRRALAAKTCT